MIMPPDAGFAQFLKRYKSDPRNHDTLKLHLWRHRFDMTKFCKCDPENSELLVYCNYDNNYDDTWLDPE